MRVVSLTCSNTEIMEAVGATALLVGVDDHSDWPPAIADLPRLGPDLGIDIDAVEALGPDLVLASLTVPGHEKIVAALEARGLPVLAPEPISLADVARDLREIGAAVGRAAAGERAAEQFESSLRPHPATGVRLTVEWWPKPVYVPGRDSWVTELIALAGGVNPFGEAPVKSLAITPEQAEQLDAVVISWCGVPTDKYRPRLVRDRPGWERVPAVLRNRIEPIPEAFLGRPGPRLARGLELLTEIVRAAR